MQIKSLHFLAISFLGMFLPFYWIQAQFSIFIHPAGDAQHTGRTVAGSYERSYSSKIAHAVKKIIYEKYPQEVAINITHNPSDKVVSLDNANRVNQAEPNIYIHIGCYQSTDQSLAINLFTPSLEPWYISDYLVTDKNGWISFEDVHKRHKRMTDTYAKKITSFFRSKQPVLGFISDHIACPYESLIGINAPAIAIEFAIRNDFDCAIYAQSLADVLVAVIGDSLCLAEVLPL